MTVEVMEFVKKYRQLSSDGKREMDAHIVLLLNKRTAPSVVTTESGADQAKPIHPNYQGIEGKCQV